MKEQEGILIEDCVNALYRAISCEPDTEPNYDELSNLFVEHAIMAEYEKIDSTKPNLKTIEEHIEEIKHVFKEYPIILKKGFYESSLSIKIMINGPIATVYSDYEKRYYNGKMDTIEFGVNNLQLIKIKGEYKILSISWYEK